jgi:transcriptional regulator NrdR family protein
MKCPICGFPADVIDTRVGRFDTIRRRHECMNLHRFSTFEVHEAAKPYDRELAANERRNVAAAKRWRRDLSIRNDPRPTILLAHEHNLTTARIRQIRAAGRKPKGTEK